MWEKTLQMEYRMCNVLAADRAVTLRRGIRAAVLVDRTMLQFGITSLKDVTDEMIESLSLHRSGTTSEIPKGGCSSCFKL
jgi:hypothetical protein